MGIGNLANAFNLLINLHARSVTIERIGESEIVSGLVPATSADLTSDISEGVAYISGIRVEVDTTPNTYTLETDTYIDLSSAGAYTFVEVPNGNAAPAVTTGNMRIYKVITDDTAITTVTALKRPKTSYGIAPSAIRAAPANYFRNLAGPEEIVVEGREFVLSKSNLDSVKFPAPKRGDRITDPGIAVSTITEVREMFGFGGALIGYRIRTS